MFEELKALIDGSQGEAIDVPHPNQFKKQEMKSLTKWHRSELPSDFERNALGGPLMIEDPEDPHFGRPLTYVYAEIVSMTLLDAYDEPVGDPIYSVQVKITNPKFKIDDISSHRVRAFTVKELRRRFPAAFAEFERNLGADKLPIALLDDVPPHVLQQLQTAMGIKKVMEFAMFDDKALKALRSKLEAAKLHARIPYIEKYREAARLKVGYTDPAPVRRERIAA